MNPVSEVSLGWVARVVTGVLGDTVDASLTAEVEAISEATAVSGELEGAVKTVDA